MADQELLGLLTQGVSAWNAWRKAHPTARLVLRNADLSGAALSEANLNGAGLSMANLNGADLSRANLIGADLRGATVSRADLRRAGLRGANLSGANLDGANLIEANLIEANLIGASLIGSDLIGADLSRSDLSRADLSRASLMMAAFVGANLSGAELSKANLSEADFSRADLRGANLSEADLSRANLSGASLTTAYLHKANLDRAILHKTILAALDLSSCKGLERCTHYGPSHIDIDTLQRSGSLPLAFLRGVGLPDMLIDYLPSILIQPIQLYSCFISYSNKNEDFARRLHADLQAKGVRCWFAPEDMKIGAKLLDTIDEAIRLRDKVLLVLSEASIVSEWVEDEVTKAYAEERRRSMTVLFPIRLDNTVFTTGEAWARKLYDGRHIGDFRSWKEHDAYQKALGQLLRDLRIEAT